MGTRESVQINVSSGAAPLKSKRQSEQLPMQNVGLPFTRQNPLVLNSNYNRDAGASKQNYVQIMRLEWCKVRV